MDKKSINELLVFILESLKMVQERFAAIDSSDDFLDTKNGLLMLDAISMRLQSVGEALKNIDKRDRDFLFQVADKNYWSNIIKTREILTHHYIDIDSEIVFMICDEKIEDLEKKIIALQQKLF